jgi:DNA-binding MarR family transcriptional regulator
VSGQPDDDVAPHEVEALLDLVPVFVGLALAAHDVEAVPVTLPQFRALFAIDRWGPCSAGGLAQRLGVHTSSVTRVCDRLVRARHMTRGPNPENRREVVLAVTDSGRALVREVLEIRAREVRRVLSALPELARRDLVRLSAEVVAADARTRGAGWVG